MHRTALEYSSLQTIKTQWREIFASPHTYAWSYCSWRPRVPSRLPQCSVPKATGQLGFAPPWSNNFFGIIFNMCYKAIAGGYERWSCSRAKTGERNDKGAEVFYRKQAKRQTATMALSDNSRVLKLIIQNASSLLHTISEVSIVLSDSFGVPKPILVPRFLGRARSLVPQILMCATTLRFLNYRPTFLAFRRCAESTSVRNAPHLTYISLDLTTDRLGGDLVVDLLCRWVRSSEWSLGIQLPCSARSPHQSTRRSLFGIAFLRSARIHRLKIISTSCRGSLPSNCASGFCGVSWHPGRFDSFN